MTCRSVADFILAYQSRELAPDVRRAFERHLERCANCRRYLALYEATVELGRAVYADDSLPAEEADVPRDLIVAILASRRAEDPR